MVIYTKELIKIVVSEVNLYYYLFFVVSSLILFSVVSLNAQNVNPFLPHIVQMESCNPNDTISTKEQESLSSLFQDSRIIALGEATHGTHEIFTMKHKLIKFLVESKDFKLIGLEAGVPEVDAINRYILLGEGNASAFIRQLGMWSIGNNEMLELITWLKQYNQTQRKQKKVRVCGIDAQMTDSAAQVVAKFLQRVNPRYADTILNDTNYYQWYITTPTNAVINRWKYRDSNTQQICITNAIKVLQHFDTHQKEYEKRTSTQEFAWARRNAWVISHALSFINDVRLRDSCMAENVSWLLEYYREKKIILWAHNEHIACKYYQVRNYGRMGWYLRKQYEKQYCAIALTANQGFYTAVTDRLRQDNQLLLDTTSHYVESYLHALQIAQGFVNFRAIQSNDPYYSWFQEKQIMRFLGANADSRQFSYTQLLKDYDGLVFIDGTTASRPLPNYHLMR